MHESKTAFTNLFILLFFVAGIIIIFTTQNSYGGADSIMHYQMAHWGWTYPELLFNHWGKPVFTILLSPFAQFGYAGAQLYNLIIGMLTAIVIWKIAIQLDLSYSEYSPLLVILTPVYFTLMFTSLTETTFSFFLSLSILLFFKKRYYLTAILISALPFIRSEGIVLISLFALAFLLKKKFLPLFLFTTFFWLISVLGYIYHDSLWWLITEFPYTGRANKIYGSGTWYHFIYNDIDNKTILGKLLSLMFVVGIIVTVVNWVKKERVGLTNTFYFLLLVIGSYIVFFVAHSYVWWQGIGNSLGLIRVIGSVTPLAALVALIGLGYFLDKVRRHGQLIVIICAVSFITLNSYMGINDYIYDFKESKPQKVMRQAVDFVKENELITSNLYYSDPYVPFILGIDPFKHSKFYGKLPNRLNPELGIPDSSIIIWDAHFGINERKISFKTLDEQMTLEKIGKFVPKDTFKVFSGDQYKVNVYRKNSGLSKDLFKRVDLNFEDDKRATQDMAKSGSASLHVTKGDTFTDILISYLKSMQDKPTPMEIHVSGFIYADNVPEEKLCVVCAISNDTVTVYYEEKKLLNKGFITLNDWNFFSYKFLIKEAYSLDCLLKVYLWNTKALDFYIDDIIIELNEIPLEVISKQ